MWSSRISCVEMKPLLHDPCSRSVTLYVFVETSVLIPIPPLYPALSANESCQAT